MRLLPGFLVLMVSALAACAVHVDSGACPAPSPGMCPPTPCVDGAQRTGEATCQDGQWSCTQMACSVGSGTGGAGTGGADTGAASTGGAGTGGCPGGTIEASSYDQSCKVDGDCAAIYQGTLCSSCFCPNAAVDQGALAQYQADFASRSHGVNVCFCPAFPPPFCNAGVCALSALHP